MTELLNAVGAFLTAHGLSTFISIVAVYVLVKEVPQLRKALVEQSEENRKSTADIAEENRKATAEIAARYEASVKSLFERSEAHIEAVTKEMTNVIQSSAEAHSQAVKGKDEWIKDLQQQLLKEAG